MSLFAGLKSHKTKASTDAPAPTQATPPPQEAAQPQQAPPPEPQQNLAIPTVGDGGASWKARALKRAKQQAQETGSSLATVVNERWSSVTDLVKGASKSRGDRSDGGGGWRRGGGGGGGGGWRGTSGGGGGGEGWRKKRARDEGDDEEVVVDGVSSQPRKTLRIGRDSKDSDILKRFKRKVSDALPKSFGGRRDEERQSDTRGAQHEDRDGRMDDRRQREDRPRPSNRERDSDGGGRDGGRGWGERRDRPQDESRDRPRQSRDGQGETRDRPKASTEPKPPQMEEEVGVWKRGASVNHTAQQATPTLPEPRAPTQPPPSAPSAGPSTNQSVAEMLRAKLLGRQAIPAPTHPPRDSSSSSTGGPMKVAPLDRQGRVLSKLTSASGDVTLAKEDLRHGRRKGLLKKHAGADDEVSLEQLVRQEREGGHDMDMAFAKNVMRLGGHYKGVEGASSRSGFDEEDEVDVTLFNKREQRFTEARNQEVQRQEAIRAEKQFAAMMHTNFYSMENPRFKSHLVVARGEHSYVMLVNRGRVSDNQCVIVPIRQATSIRAVGEEVYEEIQKWKSSLSRFFGSNGQGVLFIEHSPPRNQHHWGRLEAVGLPVELEEDAPLYFKQALTDADAAWATHKPIIDLRKHNLSIRKAIPSSFPYFSVEWKGGGYVHIIEDQDMFPMSFGIDTIAGMLGIPPPNFDNEASQMSFEKEKELAKAFQSDFGDYDWTVASS